MENIKKKQHYVWKNYILNWSTDNKVFAYTHNNKKPIHSNPENIAQQRYYYALEEFTIEEEVVLFEFIKTMGLEVDLNFNIELFKIYTIYSNLKRQLDSKYEKELTPKKKEIYESHLKILKSNTLENLHSRIESLGFNLMNIKTFQDLKFLNNNEELYKTILFICIQSTRTKSMKSALEVNFKNHSYINSKYFNLIPLLFSIPVARNLCLEKELRFIYIENQTSEKFITTDQPVINIDKDDKDEHGHIKNLRYYYPISPEIAIIIHYAFQEDKFICKNADIKFVEELNNYMIENSTEFIVFSTKNQIDKYMNSL